MKNETGKRGFIFRMQMILCKRIEAVFPYKKQASESNSVKKRSILFLACFCLAILLQGCGFFAADRPKSTIKVYTTLDKSFLETLCSRYSDGLPADKKVAFTILDHETDLAQADCMISDIKRLEEKAAGGSLQKIQAEYGDLLPSELKDREDRWIILFYDPVVVLVNQAYSRKAGQRQIMRWLDLPSRKDAQFVMENLSDNDSTVMFLAAMSSRMGQNEFFDWFRQLRPQIKQYARFPITPVRMAATGDADIAITRRSHVFKYLQNDFPAYILLPAEGTPVNLYGIGITKTTKQQKELTAFVNWLLQAPEARTALLATRSGYLPVLPQGEQGQTVNMDKLWLNTYYKEEKAIAKLTEDWLKEIRLADAGEAKK